MIYVTWHHLTVPKTPVGLMASPTLLLFILRELRFCIRHRNIRYDAYTIRTNYTFRIWLLFFEFFMFPMTKIFFLSHVCSTIFYFAETSRNSIVILSGRCFNNNYFLFIFQACLNDIQEVISLQHPQALSGKLVNLQKFCQRKLSSSQHLIHGKYWCFLMLSFTFGLLFCTILTECNCICSSKFYFRWGYFTEHSHCYRRTTQQNSQWIQFDWNQLHSQPGTIFEGWLSRWHNTNKSYKMGKNTHLQKFDYLQQGVQDLICP